jgi:hypothetical protein
MNYSALIQNRKSAREFTEQEISYQDLNTIRNYCQNAVRRLVPEIETELYFFGRGTGAALEGAAGYNQFLVGAPQYLVLLTEKHPLSYINAGYMMQDVLLKLADMNLDSCWLTFTNSEDIKGVLGIASHLEVAAIAAFGYGKKTVRRLRLNLRSMSNVDIVAKHRYMEPKRSVEDMAFLDTWGNTQGLDKYLGFFDDMLWEAIYAASLSPSYLNRQAYGFLLKDGEISLVERPDRYNVDIDKDLSRGIVLLHFSAVAENWAGKLNWRFGKDAAQLILPEGHRVVATCAV